MSSMSLITVHACPKSIVWREMPIISGMGCCSAQAMSLDLNSSIPISAAFLSKKTSVILVNDGEQVSALKGNVNSEGRFLKRPIGTF